MASIQSVTGSTQTEPIDTENHETQAAPAATEAAPAEPKDHIVSADDSKPNAYVAFVDKFKQKIDDEGTAMVEQADKEGRMADHDLDVAQQKARAAWASGNHLAAMAALGEGLFKGGYHRANEVANEVSAFGMSVKSGLMDVAEGKKEAMEAVGVGVALVAAVPTGGASLSLVEAASTMYGAYQTTQTVGELMRAKNGKEAATAAVKLGVGFVMAGAEKKVGDLAEKGIEKGVEGAGKALARAATRSTGDLEGGAQIAKNAEHIAHDLAKPATEAFMHFTHESADKIVERAADQVRSSGSKD